MRTIHLPDEGKAATPLLFKHVLFIAKDVKLVHDVRDVLDTRFCDVTAVEDAPGGMRAILGSDFDIIVCDMTNSMLPGKVFFETVQRVKPHLAKRFISITDSKHSHLSLGSISVWKPLDMQILMEAIDAILSKNKLTTPITPVRPRAGKLFAHSRH